MSWFVSDFLRTCGIGAAGLALPACGDDLSPPPDGAVGLGGDFAVPPFLDGELVGTTRVFRPVLHRAAVKSANPFGAQRL